MSWSPIPDDDYAPLEHERDKFFSVLIDETSQTAHLEAGISAAWAGTVVPPMQRDGTPRVMKWEKLKAYNFAVYKKVVDTVFNFRRAYKLPLNKDVAVPCVGVDTSVKFLRNTGA